MKDDEIQQFKSLLLKLREQVRGDIESSIDAIAEEIRPVGDNTNEPSEGLDKELILEQNEEELYLKINKSLERIEAGTFGKCGDCGKTIPKARLQAIPYTAYCIDCERRIESEI